MCMKCQSRPRSFPVGTWNSSHYKCVQPDLLKEVLALKSMHFISNESKTEPSTPILLVRSLPPRTLPLAVPGHEISHFVQVSDLKETEAQAEESSSSMSKETVETQTENGKHKKKSKNRMAKSCITQ